MYSYFFNLHTIRVLFIINFKLLCLSLYDIWFNVIYILSFSFIDFINFFLYFLIITTVYAIKTF